MTENHQTEAACLLQSGALYHHRIGLQPEQGEFVFAGFKQGAFSLYFGDAPIFHFDLEGRWQRAYTRDLHYLKRLDGSIHEINRVREGSNLVLKRRMLDEAESRRLDSEIREVARTLRSDVDARTLRIESPPLAKAKAIDSAALGSFLDRIAGWDDSAWSAHRRLYNDVYGPLPFTPPSCQNAVILQATRGDAGGRSFGGGEAHPHAVRTPREFAEHLRTVVALIGGRLHQTKAVFLAGADVLRQPIDDVLGYFDAIGRALPLSTAIEHIHVFIDDFSDPVPGVELLEAARKRRLSHVALGIESGDPVVRGLYGKTWPDEAVRDFVSRAKASGVELSVLTLVGAGGAERGADHVAATARLIESLPLARGDLVFLLDDREIAGSTIPGATPLDQAAWSAQLEQLRQALSPLRDRGVKVLPYSMAKQWA